MLYIEQGGEAQLADELEVHNPLIPQGSELSATIMFEIDDRVRQAATLAGLGGIENHAFIYVASVRVGGVRDPTRENTSRNGKASSVQFLKFAFAPTEIAAFKAPGTAVVLGFDHPNYAHMAVAVEPVRAALAQDLD
jgi:hypothetical protein